MSVVFGTVDALPMKVNLLEIVPGVLLADDEFELSAFSVSHRGPGCFGFAFAEKEKRPFLVEKAEALGVPFGPIRRLLVQGEPVTLDDSRVVRPDDVLGPATPGAKLVFVGDVGRTEDLVAVAAGATALVIEATYLEEEADMARKFGHLTAARAARLAREAGVGTLILNHLSRRYSARQVLAEARPIFENTLVASDFDRLRIVKQEPVERVADEARPRR
jgi:ribonuclease Z